MTPYRDPPHEALANPPARLRPALGWRRRLALALVVFAAGTGCTPETGLSDLEGRRVDPLAEPSAATVLLFVRRDCPISRRYAPEVQRLWERYRPRGVRFFEVYPNPRVTAEEIRRHRRAFDVPFPALRDPHHRWVEKTGVTVTPEAVVFDASGRRVYRGRIDDRWAAFGRFRPEPTRRDLAEVLDALVAGRPVEPHATEAIGCFIEDLA